MEYIKLLYQELGADNMSHLWGDSWFKAYGDDLYAAEKFIANYVYRWSLCRLMSKEKYGTIRYEHISPPYSGYGFGPHLYIPFYRYSLSGKDYKIKDCKKFIWIWNCSWLHAKWQWYGWKTCLKAVRLAIKKWPHLEYELMSDIASNEELVGKKIHKKYWRSMND